MILWMEATLRVAKQSKMIGKDTIRGRTKPITQTEKCRSLHAGQTPTVGHGMAFGQPNLRERHPQELEARAAKVPWIHRPPAKATDNRLSPQGLARTVEEQQLSQWAS